MAPVWWLQSFSLIVRVKTPLRLSHNFHSCDIFHKTGRGETTLVSNVNKTNERTRDLKQ
uniref:Uncharacterized protein n=1 Tax=Anguilla anguilla TaxID=7936 RepID=A0A0E9PLF2_ANGAN